MLMCSLWSAAAGCHACARDGQERRRWTSWLRLPWHVCHIMLLFESSGLPFLHLPPYLGASRAHLLIFAGQPLGSAMMHAAASTSAAMATAAYVLVSAVILVAPLRLLLAPLPTAQAFVTSPTSSIIPPYRSLPRSQHMGLPNQFQLSAHTTFLDDLSSRFQGDFDNYDQVLDDRTAHTPPLTPREGGGHEHIHCTLVPVNDINDVAVSSSSSPGSPSSPSSPGSIIRRYVREDAQMVRLAAFYFDGLPERIFRFRLYALWDASTSTDTTTADGNGNGNGNDQGERVGMTLYSLSPEVEGMLRGLSGRPLEWVPALLRYLQSASSSSSSDVGTDSTSQPFLELHGCDVEWRPDPDPDRHAYAYGSAQASSSRVLQPDEAHHAVMVNGEATIPSLMNPGSMIRVVDELSLWEDDFWINDRGFDPDTGDFVYGNQRGVPYKMRRVSSLIQCRNEDGDGESGPQPHLQRRIDNEALAWTLGDEYRTSEEYTVAMEAIGGVSAKMNSRPPAASPSKGG